MAWAWSDNEGAVTNYTFGSEWIGTHDYYLLDQDDIAYFNTRYVYVEGGSGYDLIDGGGVNVWYFVANGGTGDDTIRGSTGDDAIEGAGGDDELDGREGSDDIYAGYGSDLIWGGGGADRIFGGSGDDTMRGGDGDDFMSGDLGNDEYEVFEKGDVVAEFKDGGYDTIWSRVTYKVPDNVEAIFTIGYDDIKFTGNSLANDMRGGGGNNTLIGGSGNDTLNGWDGKDRLEGGAGKDVYFFNYVGSENTDKVIGFKPKDDNFWLQRDNLFLDINDGSGLVKLTKDQFHASTSGKAADKEDRILYDTNDGKLYYDRDGTGSTYDRVLFATLDKHLALTNADFWIW